MIDTVLCAHPLVTWQGLVIGYALGYCSLLAALFVGYHIGVIGEDDDP